MMLLRKFSLVLFMVIYSINVLANNTPYNKKLFSLLDLDIPGMEKVKVAVKSKDYEKAANELLNYYRIRTHISHPDINVTDKSYWYGKEVEEKIMEKANKGLEHKFFVHEGYGYLDYGKDIDWTYWPVKDNEIRWQINRMYWWIPMGKMYWSTGDEKYVNEWIFQFRDWVKDNPKGLSKENDRFAWRPLECSRRVQDQTTLFNYFLHSVNFTSEFLIEFLLNYHTQAEWVSGNYTKVGNHRLFQAQRMVYAGGFFQEFKNAERWRNEGIDILNKQMKVQILEDGFHYELSQNYHVGSINIFLKALKMARLCNLENEFPKEYLETIRKMIYANIKVSFPDLIFPMFGDAKRETKSAMLKKFKEWQTIFPNDEIIAFFASKGKQGKAPSFLSTRLSKSGFTAFRNGWGAESTSLIMRAGIPGGWFHSQPDNGTFALWHKGVNLMPDAGVYVYAGDDEIMKMRNWYRQSSIHQILTINNKDITVDGKALKWSTSENLDYLVFENKSYKDLKHRRTVFFIDKKFFVIIDEAIGDALGNVNIRYQVKEGEASYDYEQNAFWSANPNEPNVRIDVFSNQKVSTNPENLKVSYRYRRELPRKGVAFSILKADKKPVRMVSVINPFDASALDLDIKCDFIQVSKDKVSIKLEIQGELYNIAYNLE